MKQFFNEFWQTKAGKCCVGFLIPAIFLFVDLILNSAAMELAAIGVALADMCFFLTSLFCFFMAVPRWARFWTYLFVLVGIPALLSIVVLICWLGGFVNGKDALDVSGNILVYVFLPILGTWGVTWIIRYILSRPKLRSFFEICLIFLLPFYLDGGGVGVVLLWSVAYALTQKVFWEKILYLEAVLSIVYMVCFLAMGRLRCVCKNISSPFLWDRCNLGCRNGDIWIWEIIIWVTILLSILLNAFLKRHKMTRLGAFGRFVLQGLLFFVTFVAVLFCVKIILSML